MENQHRKIKGYRELSQSEIDAMKLPKQWMYWAQKAGLRREWGRGQQSTHYLIGRGRRWRVNCHGIFECSCPTQYFDRWANSRGAEMAGVPTTEDAFLAAVRDLRERSKDVRGED